MERGGFMPDCYETKRGINLSVTGRFIGGGWQLFRYVISE